MGEIPKAGRRKKLPELGGCPHCIQGYQAVGQNDQGLPITVQCGYCHGLNNRKIK